MGRRAFLEALATSALVACAAESAGTDGAGSGGGGGEAPEDDHAYEELPARSGTITVFESFVESSRQTGLIAAFLDIDQGDPGACAREVRGPCDVTWCKAGAVGLDALADAGTLAVDFGDEEGPRETSRNPATGFYLDLRPEGLLEPGRTVVLSSSGALVPAYAVELLAPAEIEITSTLPRTGDTLPTDVPFEVTWAAIGEAGAVRVVLEAERARRRVTALCRYDVLAGSGAVPMEVLALFAAMETPTTASISIQSESATEVLAGDFPLSLALLVTAEQGGDDAVRYLAGFAP